MIDKVEVRRIEVALHDAGWADHASLDRAISGWVRLAKEVGAYPATVDDYTNDLTSRDYIAAVMARATPALREAIREQVARADSVFQEATIDDDERRLARYFRIDRKDGWWWRRRPPTGALADYLADG